jgi:hypothetical protein
MYKQRSTKHTHKTKDRGARAPLKTGGELRCSRRVSSSCSTSGICRINLFTNPVISHEQSYIAPLKCISKLLTYILSTLRTGPQSYCDINYEMADMNQM